jgi:hypothetical protein
MAINKHTTFFIMNLCPKDRRKTGVEEVNYSSANTG